MTIVFVVLTATMMVLAVSSIIACLTGAKAAELVYFLTGLAVFAWLAVGMSGVAE